MAERSFWTDLHAQIHRILRQRQLLPQKQRLLVAVSGGQDSLSLAKLLLDLQPKWGWHLAIAHCDHRWRQDSEANANHVEKLAKTWQLAFFCQTAKTKFLKSEAAAREWRYQALSALAQQHDYPYIVTGHTASDRAETLLYNLIRGSGADGLQSLTWQRPLADKVKLVRPLLEVTRTQTGKFCEEMQLPIWEDSTNQDLKYARNRIRHKIIPYLQQHFNPQVEQALAQTAELLQAEVQYLEDAAHQLLQQATEQGSRGAERQDRSPITNRLNRLVVQNAPLALQRRVIRQFLQQELASAPSFEQVEKLTALITAPNRSRTDPFPGGAIAEVDDDWICLK
ncbi:tRNA lysidine(34) synthetase TilS [Argonema antarcticum]|uniref:tRNA lysidine(34) synthetase TilS n=1 Tax=Argonema antarcticum TaxID=2942763 RepID=UPI0020135C34|nr:tRNA lysidine(34) synthetase TilS [Argonema antarcticum]MCL1474805.1 tRNA lysidine(34) synthetase TilS [Argonema antarcticum A004/B2]